MPDRPSRRRNDEEARLQRAVNLLYTKYATKRFNSLSQGLYANMAPMDVEKDKKDGVGEDAPKNGDNKKPEEEATTIVTTANLAADEVR